MASGNHSVPGHSGAQHDVFTSASLSDSTDPYFHGAIGLYLQHLKITTLLCGDRKTENNCTVSKEMYLEIIVFPYPLSPVTEDI